MPIWLVIILGILVMIVSMFEKDDDNTRIIEDSNIPCDNCGCKREKIKEWGSEDQYSIATCARCGKRKW